MKKPGLMMLVVSLFTFALVLMTGCQEPPRAPTGPGGTPVATAYLPTVAERWEAMTEQERGRVCTAASGPLPGEGEVGGAAAGSPSDGVDYREMLKGLENAGNTQSEAAAMIPYALRQCR